MTKRKNKKVGLVELKIDEESQPPFNLYVAMYKLKFRHMVALKKSLEDYQQRHIVAPDTMYAQGVSDGFDLAMNCFQDVTSNYENKK